MMNFFITPSGRSPTAPSCSNRSNPSKPTNRSTVDHVIYPVRDNALQSVQLDYGFRVWKSCFGFVGSRVGVVFCAAGEGLLGIR